MLVEITQTETGLITIHLPDMTLMIDVNRNTDDREVSTKVKIVGMHEDVLSHPFNCKQWRNQDESPIVEIEAGHKF